MRSPISFCAMVMVALGAITQEAPAQLSPAARADLVLSLLPADSRPGATVLLRDEHGDDVYREGDGRFLCVSDASPADRISMICHHQVLEERLRYERSLRDATGLGGDEFRERLCKDVEAEGLGVPPGSMEITATLLRDDEGGHAEEMTVYHLLWVPGESAASMGVPDEDPGEGRPFLHHAETCGAHVMWSEAVPVP